MMNLPFSLLANQGEAGSAPQDVRGAALSEVENKIVKDGFSLVFQDITAAAANASKARTGAAETLDVVDDTSEPVQADTSQDELFSEEVDLKDLRKAERALLPKESAKGSASTDDSLSTSPGASFGEEVGERVWKSETLASAPKFTQERITLKKTPIEPTLPRESDFPSNSSFVEIGRGRFTERPSHGADPSRGAGQGLLRMQFETLFQMERGEVPQGVETPSESPQEIEGLGNKSQNDLLQLTGQHLSEGVAPLGPNQKEQVSLLEEPASTQGDILSRKNIDVKDVLPEKAGLPTQTFSPETRGRAIESEVTAKLGNTQQLGEMREMIPTQQTSDQDVPVVQRTNIESGLSPQSDRVQTTIPQTRAPFVKTELTSMQAKAGTAVPELEPADQSTQHVSVIGRPESREHPIPTRPDSPRADTTRPATTVVDGRQSVGKGMPSQSAQISAPQVTEILADVPVETEQIVGAAGVLETRGGTAPNVQMNASQISRSEQASLIGRQLVAVSHQAQGGGVELTLNPEELGRVRMGITGVDGAITVSILAERAETLDLMRKHMDQLAQEFRDIGYSDVSFAFDQQTDGQDEQKKGSQSNTLTKLEDTEDAPVPVTLAVTSGVDMRL